MAGEFEQSAGRQLELLGEKQQRLKEAEELHGEHELVGYELMELEDELTAKTAEIEALELEVDVVNQKTHKLVGQAGGAGAWGQSQEDEFEGHVLRYFDSLSERLGLDVTVQLNDLRLPLFAPSGVTPGSWSAAAGESDPDNCSYNVQFRCAQGCGGSSLMGLTLKVSPLRILEVHPPLDVPFLETLSEAANRNQISLARFLVGIRQAFLKRYVSEKIR